MEPWPAGIDIEFTGANINPQFDIIDFVIGFGLAREVLRPVETADVGVAKRGEALRGQGGGVPHAAA